MLTLVPSLPSIYNIKLADFGYLTGGARSMSIGPESDQKSFVCANGWCLQNFP